MSAILTNCTAPVGGPMRALPNESAPCIFAAVPVHAGHGPSATMTTMTAMTAITTRATTANRTAPSAPRRDARSLAPVIAHIAAHLAEPLPLDELAAIAGLSVWRFATVFRERIGMAPHRYVSTLRVQHAQALLREGATLASAASESGFCDQSHLSRRFKRLCGMTPGQYQAGHAVPTPPAAHTGSDVPASH